MTTKYEAEQAVNIIINERLSAPRRRNDWTTDPQQAVKLLRFTPELHIDLVEYVMENDACRVHLEGDGRGFTVTEYSIAYAICAAWAEMVVNQRVQVVEPDEQASAAPEAETVEEDDPEEWHMLQYPDTSIHALRAILKECTAERWITTPMRATVPSDPEFAEGAPRKGGEADGFKTEDVQPVEREDLSSNDALLADFGLAQESGTGVMVVIDARKFRAFQRGIHNPFAESREE